jgi:hypothetical protein
MEQLTHDKQVSGSSTLVGSLLSLSLGKEPVEKARGTASQGLVQT